MSRGELIALGIKLELSEEPEPNEEVETVTNNNINIETPRVSGVKFSTKFIQLNRFHNVVDISSIELKKLHQKSTQGFPKEKRHKGHKKTSLNSSNAFKVKVKSSVGILSLQTLAQTM